MAEKLPENSLTDHASLDQSVLDLSDDQLLRYSRQIMLPEIDLKGQTALLSARMLIIGVGGLGSPVALYLSACGVGCITIADPDRVELSNLQRQIAHSENDIKLKKVSSCKNSMSALNHEINIRTLPVALAGDILLEEVAQADIVVDCTDNLATRFAINKACVKTVTPMVSAASIRWEGQITVFHPGFKDSPCYHCFHDESRELDESCSDNGVLGPVVGVMGSMQAIEVVKLITQSGDSLIGRVLLFDALSMQWETMILPANPKCKVCSREKPLDQVKEWKK